MTLEQRFFAKVRRGQAWECWMWTASNTGFGYGQMWIPAEQRLRLAHRISYEWFIGPIPEGLDIDHLCRVRSCVNPFHLEPVTRAVNLLRGVQARPPKPACKWGHAYTPENTLYQKRNTPSGRQRVCRTCSTEAARRKRREARERRQQEIAA